MWVGTPSRSATRFKYRIADPTPTEHLGRPRLTNHSSRQWRNPIYITFCVQGVISPMLSNIYLHEVLDKWFFNEVKPRLKGEAFLIRFADDEVLVFARKEDAERVMEVLPKRFGKYGLTVHPEKTRLIWFGKPEEREGETQDPPRWEKFTFLGFTHYWGRSRKGQWVVKRKTEAGRFTRALKKVAEWCRRNRHGPLKDQ